MNKAFLAFDLETQRDAQSVGGWGHIPDMKMSVGVLWDSRKNDFSVYYENQIQEMIEHLTSGPRVIGFNHIFFDYPVVSGYTKRGQEREALLTRLSEQKNLDLLIDLKERLGHRLKLDSLVRPTLEIGKSADGLQALEWYKEYIETKNSEKLQLIVSYCKQDVAITRDLYLYGLEKNEVFYETKSGIKAVKVDWEEKEQVDKYEEPEQMSF